VDALPVEFLREFDDAYRVEGAFLDAYPAASAKIFVNYWFLLSSYELDRVSSIEYFGAESVAWYSTIVRFTVFLV